MDAGVILAFILAGAAAAIVAIVFGAFAIANSRLMSRRTLGTFLAAVILMLVGIGIALT